MKEIWNYNTVNFPSISIYTKLELFDELVLPILNYGSEIWGLTESMAIERVQFFFCKTILGVKIQTQNNVWEFNK